MAEKKGFWDKIFSRRKSEDPIQRIESMLDDAFWEIIEKSRHDNKSDQLPALQRQLVGLEPEEIIAFHNKFDDVMDKSYTWDLWGAAYVMMGGCSDDAFDYFRSWLISKGRKVHEQAMKDADSLAEIDFVEETDEDFEFEEFMYVVHDAYEEKTGKRMPPLTRSAPRDPAGDPWEEEEEDLAKRFPRLMEKYWE